MTADLPADPTVVRLETALRAVRADRDRISELLDLAYDRLAAGVTDDAKKWEKLAKDANRAAVRAMEERDAAVTEVARLSSVGRDAARDAAIDNAVAWAHSVADQIDVNPLFEALGVVRARAEGLTP